MSGRPQRPNDAYVVNGWYLILPGLVSPHFERLEGLSKKTGNVTIVDGGSNITYNFSSQIKNFGQITLARTRDGSVDDAALRLLVDASIAEGVKYAGALVKLHHGREVYRIAFSGIKFMEDNRPTYDTSSEEKDQQMLVATVDEWVEV